METKEDIKRPLALLEKSLQNHHWRQSECINLIPSEMTLSPLVRLLTVTDPSFRYAEHEAFTNRKADDIFYYQGTDYIADIERRLVDEFKRYLGCTNVEVRPVSGQMSNATVFSAVIDNLNRSVRSAEPRRLRKVINHHIGNGGHLSAQPTGALKDYIMRDPETGRPCVINFPVLPDNPYRIDLEKTLELIDLHRPELIIFGKSMVLTKEPIREVRRFVDDQNIDTVLHYDMAHVLGLAGPYFQKPFEDGADLVTGSTHKTFFGTQRGIIAGNFPKESPRYRLWKSIQRRSFPGAVSNHHLGTMTGLLLASMEMNRFRDAYQRAVLQNAKSFARALYDCGLAVEGDPTMDFTQTHQVVVYVGKGKGPDTAARLEENHIICNYQALPTDKSFKEAGGLRMGVAEMTRFGMGSSGFQELAQLIFDVVKRDKTVVGDVHRLRRQYVRLRYCFSGREIDEAVNRFIQAIF